MHQHPTAAFALWHWTIAVIVAGCVLPVAFAAYCDWRDAARHRAARARLTHPTGRALRPPTPIRPMPMDTDADTDAHH